MRKYLKNNSGFTLLEVLAALEIFILIFAVAVGIFMSSYNANTIVFEQLLTQSEGRRAVQDFMDEARRANYSSIGAYPIAAAGTSTLIFYSDVNGDTFKERVRYFLAGAILKKGIIIPTGTPLVYVTSSETLTEVAHSVTNPATSSIFYYYDQNFDGMSTSTPLSQPVTTTAVRMIELRLILEKDGGRSPVPLTAQGKAAIRNMKSN